MKISFVLFLCFCVMVGARFSEDHVHTPYGLKHKDCVIEVAAGSHVTARNVEGVEHAHILHANGTEELRTPCPHTVPSQKKRDTPSWQGYAEHWWYGANFIASNPLTAFSATWTVPPVPAEITANTSSPWPNAPTLSFWIGLQSTTNNINVLQPVLEFNGLIAHAYDISSWNCCPAGYTFHSTPVAASPGNVVVGSISLVTPSDPYTFNIVTSIQGGQTTSLVANMSSSQIVYNWAEVITEAYFVTTCKQLPSQSARFTITSLVNTNKAKDVTTIPWTTNSYECDGISCPTAAISNQCHGSNTVSSNVVSIGFTGQ